MSANEYARQRGRDPIVPSSAAPNRPASPSPARLLSAREQEQAAETRAAVRELMPEVLPAIKELHELGMIDGWRNVSITPIQQTGSQA